MRPTVIATPAIVPITVAVLALAKPASHATINGNDLPSGE